MIKSVNLFKRNEDMIDKFKNKFDDNIVLFKASFKSLKQEGKETIEMLSIFLNKTKNKEGVSEEELKKMNTQLKDLGKISFMLPFVILPGSPITIPIVYKLADKLNIDLTPTSFKNLNSYIEEIKNKQNIKDNKDEFNNTIEKEKVFFDNIINSKNEKDFTSFDR